MAMRPKVPPRKGKKDHRRRVSESHIRMIRQMPCILSGREAEAAHVSYGDLEAGKPGNAMGLKASDDYAVPLCPELHRLNNGSQHHSEINERDWWAQFGINPIEIAQQLFAVGRNYEAMLAIVNNIKLTPAARDRVMAILRGEK